jgi:hypothetical protein
VGLGGYADRDLRLEHFRAGLHRLVTHGRKLLHADVPAGEEFNDLHQDAGAVGGDHLNQVRQQVRGGFAGRRAVMDDLEFFVAAQLA